MKENDDALSDFENFDYSKVCFLSSFPPRECGIATFTKDLTSAMDKKFNPRLKSQIIALNENVSFYNYGDKVIMQINKDDIEDFINTAKRINNSKKIKLVCIQHEFGLFGGEYGNYIVPFLETIKKPVVVAFHSVLPNPTEVRRKVVRFIAFKSAAIIVMAKRAIKILKEDYGVREDKIHVIMHGVPNVPLCDSPAIKKRLRINPEKIVLSSFGLLNRGKGIEHVIGALPKLVKKYPNILYLVIGETHPVVRKKEGEKYRNELIQKVEELGLKNNVKFYNKYLTLREIKDYLLATDVYICPNLDKNQIVSGTLSYALGCGKAVVSTRTAYSEEVLADKRGVLVDFENPNSFVKAVGQIISDKEFRKKLESDAYAFSRPMIWPNVASAYLSIFNKIVKLVEEPVDKCPSIKLNHLRALTDNFGCIQFAKLSIPDKTSGYTVDDNSRALIAAVLHNSLFKSKTSLKLAQIYLNFLSHAQEENGDFKNFIEGTDAKSEDGFGRVIWSLGYAINKCSNAAIVKKAKTVFDKASPLISRLNHPRAKSFSIIGLYHYYKKKPDKKKLLQIRELADYLIELYEEESEGEWDWFESCLTYSNSKLPECLFLAYELTNDERYLQVAKKTLRFLTKVMFVNGTLELIGQDGWYPKGGKKAFRDQQPIDASSMVQTYLTAYNITKNKEYYRRAVLSFNWFLGKNHIKQMIYDERSGGCYDGYDGLSQDSINLNQGAESTISYLLARLSLEELKKRKII